MSVRYTLQSESVEHSIPSAARIPTVPCHLLHSTQASRSRAHCSFTVPRSQCCSQCDSSVHLCCGLEYHRPLPLCTYMHTSSHASTHERALDGTHTQALKPAVPGNESELPNRRDAEVRAMCRCQMCSHVMEHATRSDRDGTFVCRPASTRSSGSRSRAVVQIGLQHSDHVGF